MVRAQAGASGLLLVLLTAAQALAPEAPHTALQYSALSTQHSALSTQPSAAGPQRSALSPFGSQATALSSQTAESSQRSPLSPQHSPLSPQHSTLTSQHSPLSSGAELSRDLSSHGSSDPLNCSHLELKARCHLRNGCAFCSAGAEMGCRPWQKCVGPPNLCELRSNMVECQGDIASKSRCVWCEMETRCVERSAEQPAVLRDGEAEGERGQCVGCDGAFDSGVEEDACLVCGGACVEPFISLENKMCSCLGCDTVPFSNKTIDMCGVCGGSNNTCTQFPFTQQQAVGITLALSGNVLISISLNMQKYVHNENERKTGGETPYTQIPLWWIGMLVMILGETGNFLAYAYAPATLVAPLGAVSVISNSILAHHVLKESLQRSNIAGVVLAILGSVLIVTYAPGSDKELTMEILEQYMSQGSFLVFLMFIILTVIGLFLINEEYKKKYVVVYVLICSLLGCITVMCVKGVSTALIRTLSGDFAFGRLLPWILLFTLLGTTVIQIRILNQAMINFGASEVVPVYYVLFTFCTIVGGMVLYKEYHQHCPDNEPNCHRTLLFFLGCVTTFSGVFLITFGEKKTDGAAPDEREALLSDHPPDEAGLDEEEEVGQRHPRQGNNKELRQLSAETGEMVGFLSSEL